MKRMPMLITAYSLLLLPSGIFAQQMSATDVIRKADEKFNGEKSSYSLMTMTIVRPSWQRTIEFKSWTLGNDFALTLITAPPRDAGQSFLKRKNEMWNWNPSINRLIKLPPSMMSQGWMGSDYTNDDILRESSLVNDYVHEFAGEEIINSRECYRIKMTAKRDASVIWGYQIRWVDKKEFLFLKAELYDEDGILVRTETASEIKMMDGRNIPTRIELIPSEESGKKTIVTIKEIKFNINVTEDFFSQQNMRTIR